MGASPVTRRRWFRFSLRTLLVLVTLVCIYLAWAMNWIREREAYRKSPEIDRSWVVTNDDTPAPWSLRLLGERGVALIFHRKVDEAQMQTVSRLFPETRVIFYAMTRQGVTYRYRPNTIFSVLPIFDLPYYQNEVLFRENLLEPVKGLQ